MPEPTANDSTPPQSTPDSVAASLEGVWYGALTTVEAALPATLPDARSIFRDFQTVAAGIDDGGVAATAHEFDLKAEDARRHGQTEAQIAWEQDANNLRARQAQLIQGTVEAADSIVEVLKAELAVAVRPPEVSDTGQLGLLYSEVNDKLAGKTGVELALGAGRLLGQSAEIDAVLLSPWFARKFNPTDAVDARALANYNAITTERLVHIAATGARGEVARDAARAIAALKVARLPGALAAKRALARRAGGLDLERSTGRSQARGR